MTTTMTAFEIATTLLDTLTAEEIRTELSPAQRQWLDDVLLGSHAR